MATKMMHELIERVNGKYPVPAGDADFALLRAALAQTGPLSWKWSVYILTPDQSNVMMVGFEHFTEPPFKANPAWKCPIPEIVA